MYLISPNCTQNFFQSVKHVAFCLKKIISERNFTAFKNKSAAKTHIIFVETYGDQALSERKCREWI